MNLPKIIEQKLRDAGVKYRFIPLPENLALDIASHVAFHKIEMKQAMATILYRTENGLIGAVKRADTQIDEEKLKQVVGVKLLQYAGKQELEKLGVESGMVPYVGLDLPYFVDQKVLEVGQAYGTGGTKTLGMAMNVKDMVKVNRGKVGDFTVFEKSHELLKKGRQRILSGITPSGDGSLHIGNFLGAVKQFIELAKSHECFLMVADLHALTTVQNKQTLQKNTETLILNELSLLGDLKNIIFFRQSDVPMHTELQSILNNVTPLGLLKRAHAYKDKLTNPSTTLRTGDAMDEEINVGLFSYPMLMAADILIYKPDLVPVGKDQKQHVEICRDIANRFNKIYCRKIPGITGSKFRESIFREVFKLPEAYIPEEVAVVLGTDGKRKMSKSLGNIISIFDSVDVIKKQVNSTFTDPTRIHADSPGHIEGNMVFAYLDFFGDREQVTTLKDKYTQGKVSDVEVKKYLFESLMKTFAPARKRYTELKSNPQQVKKILQTGADKARSVATQTMIEVREAIGLTNQYSFFSYSLCHSGKPKAHPESVADADSRIKFGTGSGQARMTDSITLDDFARVEQRVGKVVEATNVEKSEKLIRLVVDFAEFGRRIIFTGVRPFGYTPEFFLGKQFLFVVNLAPRKMLNEYSQGMILAVDPSAGSGQVGKPIFVTAEGMPVGALLR